MSATFQAETMWRRESGLARICSTTWLDLVDVAPVGRRPGAPLVAVDRPEVAVVVGPLVPDRDAAVLQPLHVGVAAQEPQQLGEDRAGVHLLGGDQREAGAQVEAHLVAEHASGCRCRCDRSSPHPRRGSAGGGRGRAARAEPTSLRGRRVPATVVRVSPPTQTVAVLTALDVHPAGRRSTVPWLATYDVGSARPGEPLAEPGVEAAGDRVLRRCRSPGRRRAPRRRAAARRRTARRRRS